MQEDTESKQIHQEEERIKAEEKKSLEEDLEKFEQRPKPPWYGMSERGQKAIQGDSSVASDWVDRGIIDVPVADLPNPEDVASPQDFDHHISWEDAQKATLRLPEIQKEVAAGKTADDFSNEDQAAGTDNANSKRRIYELYYGSDPVRVDKIGNKYDIISGRHRIYAAKEIGLETIPARVKEKRE